MKLEAKALEFERSLVRYRIFDNRARLLWPSEVGHFVPWLTHRLDLLGDQLGLSLEYVATEAEVGDLRADLLARDGAGRRVIIEAQYGPSDHKHLGQLLTYACAGDADMLIWVVVEDAPSRPIVREEHLKTLGEPNERFAGEREFHAVEVLLESDPARSEAGEDGSRVIPRLRRRTCV